MGTQEESFDKLMRVTTTSSFRRHRHQERVLWFIRAALDSRESRAAQMGTNQMRSRIVFTQSLRLADHRLFQTTREICRTLLDLCGQDGPIRKLGTVNSEQWLSPILSS